VVTYYTLIANEGKRDSLQTDGQVVCVSVIIWLVSYLVVHKQPRVGSSHRAEEERPRPLRNRCSVRWWVHFVPSFLPRISALPLPVPTKRRWTSSLATHLLRMARFAMLSPLGNTARLPPTILVADSQWS